MVADGYKDTEIGVIPIEWDVVKIKDIGNISTSSIDKKIHPNENLVNMVNYMDVYNNHYKEINSKINFMEVSCNEAQFNSCQIVKGDVLFTPSSETADDIGLSAVVNNVPINTVHSYHLVRLRFTKDLSLHFKKFIFNSSNVLEQFTKSCQGTTRKTLKVSDFQNITIPLPPLKEQEKIADILSTADDKIDAITSQIEKAQTLKKGLLQKLLSEGIGHSEFKDSELGKIPVSWEVSKLENLVNIISGQSPSKFDLTGSEYKFFKVNQLNFCEKYLTNSEYAFDEEIDNLLDSGTVIFPKRGASIFTNKVRILTHKSFIDTNLMGLITKDTLNNMFLYYWLVEFELSNIADTSSVPQINNKHINPLKIPLPPLEEQKQIAEILSTADEKLEVLRAKKEKFETLKKGLLQKLLSGEVRV